ncbi:adhesion G protein-coupled receptor L3-like, partial [Alosa pseudoharengus]|uniref:adhesion G protein-coupled receptor L3-like n=1 Tax=Alosa pseudoharengus TaxID=34774 RepID=UPI003F8A5AD8
HYAQTKQHTGQLLQLEAFASSIARAPGPSVSPLQPGPTQILLEGLPESSSSVHLYMDTTTTRTTTRAPYTPTTSTTTTTVGTSTTSTLGVATPTTSTTLRPATLTVAPWGSRSSITQAPPAEGSAPDTATRSAPSSQLPNVAAEFCGPVVEADVAWPKTKQGLVARQLCPSGTMGTATFSCMGPEGYWDAQGPDLSNCSSHWVNQINQKLRAGETAAIIARELSDLTKGHMHPGDISYTVRAMGQLVELLDVQLRNLTPGGKDSAARSLNK